MVRLGDRPQPRHRWSALASRILPIIDFHDRPSRMAPALSAPDRVRSAQGPAAALMFSIDRDSSWTCGHGPASITPRISSSGGCGSMLISTHVAPAASQARTSAPGGTSTTRSKGFLLPERPCRRASASSASCSGPGRSIGNKPSLGYHTIRPCTQRSHPSGEEKLGTIAGSASQAARWTAEHWRASDSRGIIVGNRVRK